MITQQSPIAQQPTHYRRGDLVKVETRTTSFLATFWYRSRAGANVLLYQDAKGTRYYAEFVQDTDCKLAAKADPEVDSLPVWAI